MRSDTSSTKPKLAFDRASAMRLAAGAGSQGVKGLVVLARAYLGPLAGHGSLEKRGDLGILAMALAKLTFEAGELALTNPTLVAGAPLPVFTVDEQGRSPGLSLAHVLAVRQLWMARSDEKEAKEQLAMQAAAPRETAAQRRSAARTQHYAAGSQGYTYRSAPAYALTTTRTVRETSTMATSSSYARSGAPSITGCASCGKSHAPPPNRAPTPDYCGGGVPAAPRSPERCTSCGGGGGCKTRAPSDEACPPWTSISCETKERLRECLKEAICDFARCLADVLTPKDEAPQPGPDGVMLAAVVQRNPLAACAQEVAVNFLRCLPEALCPEECAPSAPAPAECLPCGYAVEVQR